MFSCQLGSVKAGINTLEKLQNADLSAEQKQKLDAFVNGMTTTPSEKIVRKIKSIKKYDVIRVIPPNTCVHYAVVFKVMDDKVYALPITSKEKPFADHIITKNRMFEGDYFSSYISIVSIEEAKRSFQFVYAEGKVEFNNIVTKIGEMYKAIF